MIRSMVYVACNGCGDPAGGNDSFADTAGEARAIAKRNGFTRVRVDGKLQDRCPKCSAGAEQQPALPRRYPEGRPGWLGPDRDWHCSRCKQPVSSGELHACVDRGVPDTAT